MKLNLHVVQCATTVLSCQVSMDTLCQALNTFSMRHGGYQHHLFLARGMGAINIISFWPVKGMGTNSMKELEFYEITIFVKHSTNIIVRHTVISIIFILTDALWWYRLQLVEAQLTDHYLPKDRNACIRHQ